MIQWITLINVLMDMIWWSSGIKAEDRLKIGSRGVMIRWLGGGSRHWGAYSIVVVHGISGPKTWVRFPICSFFVKSHPLSFILLPHLPFLASLSPSIFINSSFISLQLLCQFPNYANFAYHQFLFAAKFLNIQSIYWHQATLLLMLGASLSK